MKKIVFFLASLLILVELFYTYMYVKNFQNEVFIVDPLSVVAVICVELFFYYVLVYKTREKDNFILNDIIKCLSIIDFFALFFAVTCFTYGQKIYASLVIMILIFFVYTDFLASIPQTNDWFKWMNEKEKI